MAAVQETARAKVNLFLHVTGRRADGYHLLDSLAVFPEIGDVLAVEAGGAGLSLDLAGPFGAALAGEADNLVLRAGRALAEAAGVAARARLLLDKRLPVASGIGGGSADAAAALRGLARLWGVAIPPGLAVRLGADVPVCLESRPVRMAGVGEILSPVPELPACGMVLVNPGVGVATPAVFRARAGDFSPPAVLPRRWESPADLAEWLGRQRNDLAAPAISLCPVIAEVLAAVAAAPDCLLARMSGSGATCFGLFPTALAAARAAARLGRAGWWVWGGPMGVAERA